MVPAEVSKERGTIERRGTSQPTANHHTLENPRLKKLFLLVFSTIASTACPLKMGQVACPEMSVGNYQLTLHNIADEHTHVYLYTYIIYFAAKSEVTQIENCVHTNVLFKKKQFTIKQCHLHETH